ncbi:acyl-coenzyme A thioesterase 1-like [Amphiura filiformis]|uniref:acyl-coenzyme A thioesterase 1-like n=1 Tax=Amphiura filiformis TaxID=82378 RepID=UPI003B2215A4
MEKRISVFPSSVMVDQRVQISVTGLDAGSKVTIRSFMLAEKYRFEAHGHFIADQNGQIRLTHSHSVGGSYKGVQPMGLFSCMQPSPGQRSGIRYSKKDITTPLIVTLSLHNEHIDTKMLQTNESIASTQLRRWYLADHCERIVVRNGRIRGSLIKPKGRGHFPGVIDMFGHAGGLLDFRAALLASHGFAVLALAFYNYDDLPTDINEISVEYCDEAVQWFSNEPYVIKGGIGVCGVSFGGTIGLQMASRFPDKISASVVISSPIAVIEPPIKYKGKPMPYLDFDRGKSKLLPDGSLRAKGCYRDVREVSEDTKIKIENIRKMLFIVGEDDEDFDASLHASEAVKRLHANARNSDDYEVLYYPGTGHLIEPPYRPVTTMSYHRIADTLIKWGGNIEDQAKAQEDAWLQVLGFLHKHIGVNASSKL